MADISVTTDVRVQTFSGENAVSNSNQLADWINSNGIHRSQIVSISSNQVSLEKEEHMITLFYREKSISANEVPITNLECLQYDQRNDWDTLLDNAEDDITVRRQVISVTHTPMKLAQFSLQHLFSIPADNHDYKMELLTAESGSWNQFAQKVSNWLNSNLAPHQLVSLSLFEEEHQPADGKQIFHAVVTHTGTSGDVGE